MLIETPGKRWLFLLHRAPLLKSSKTEEVEVFGELLPWLAIQNREASHAGRAAALGFAGPQNPTGTTKLESKLRHPKLQSAHVGLRDSMRRRVVSVRSATENRGISDLLCRAQGLKDLRSQGSEGFSSLAARIEEGKFKQGLLTETRLLVLKGFNAKLGEGLSGGPSRSEAFQ